MSAPTEPGTAVIPGAGQISGLFVAIWDNRATSHLAPTDIEHLDVQRTLHRVTVIGEVPAGPDGRESELVTGHPFTDKHVVVDD